MKYTKPFLTFDQQAEQLLARGLEADKSELVRRLEQVNYYRLSAYWHPFRKIDPTDPTGDTLSDDFRPGTKLGVVWRRYTFDRQLRILVMDAVERAEVAIRTKLIYHFSRQHGPFGYVEPGNFVNGMDHGRFMAVLEDAVRNSSNEVFVSHYRRKYTSERYLPLWMLAEIMTFGAMFTMVKHQPKRMQKTIAAEFGLSAPVLVSWLKTLNYIRNLCAHHARLWNRELAIRPMVPEHDPAWKAPVAVPNERVFGVLTLLRYLMNRIAPQSGWTCRLMRLLNRYDELPRRVMGFPEDWTACPIWHACPALERLLSDLGEEVNA